jgi:hypothetical protein
MIKTYIVRKVYEEAEVSNRQLEVYNVTSEISETKRILLELETIIKSALFTKFKDFDYEMLIVSDEDSKTKNVNLLKLVILIDSEEKIQFLKNNLPNLSPKILNIIEFKVLKIPLWTVQVTSLEEEMLQSWADEIQRYLRNEFNFYGKVNIQASFFENEIQSFWIGLSGKGVNDDLVWVMKEISKAITLSKNIVFYTDDKYTFIDGYFKS